MRLPILEDRTWDEKYHTCVKTGGSLYKTIQVKFNTGSSEPVEDEVITTASGDTGIVTDTSITLLSGTWAGGDAAGFLELSSPTGTTDMLWGVDEEAATGDSGAAFSLDGQGIEKTNGIPIPLSRLAFYKGKWYADVYYEAMARRDGLDEVMVNINENDRGKLP
jgi:hypothetical protein